MAQVYLSLGSNIDRKKHLSAALCALKGLFGTLQVSTVYESEAVGFDGDDFYNLAVGLQTELALKDLINALRQIEDQNGRCREGPKFSARTLDIDILTYDELSGVVEGIELPRPELSVNAFVLRPMADIAGAVVHPSLGESYASLWEQYDKEKQKLWPVDFDWSS